MRARAMKQGSRRGKVCANDDKSTRQKEQINKEFMRKRDKCY